MYYQQIYISRTTEYIDGLKSSQNEARKRVTKISHVTMRAGTPGIEEGRW